MKLKIAWDNRNIDAQGIRVYRATTQFTRLNLPELYTTIAGDATYFIDEDVIQDVEYYYAFEAFKETDSVLSQVISAVAGQHYGPGPSKILRGDTQCGYFGIVNQADFIGYESLYNQMGQPGSLYQNDGDWLKVIYKNKILFVAKQPVAYGVQWDRLYELGLVYGVDGPGPREHNTLPEVNQLRTVEYRGYRFKVRLLTSVPPNWERPERFVASEINRQATVGSGYSPQVADRHLHTSYSTYEDLTGSEWNDIMYKFCSINPPDQKGENFEYLDRKLANSGSSGLDRDGLFQDLQDSNIVLTRSIIRPSNTLLTVPYPSYLNTLRIAAAGVWRPVLEMITD